MKKSLDLYLVNLDVALLIRAISMSFLNSLCEEVSESMVSSREENFLGFEFLTRNEEIDGHSHKEQGIFEENI